MPSSFKEILNSRLFKFVIGEKVDGHPTTFSVHEDAISHLSKPLYNLLKSGLSESQAGCTIWDDVGEDTFVRFAQFAYTGDYSIPATQKRKSRVAEKQSASNFSSSIAHRVNSRASSSSPVPEVEEVKEYDDLGVEATPEVMEEDTPAPPIDSWTAWGTSFSQSSKKYRNNKSKNKGAIPQWEESFPEPETEPEPDSEPAPISKRDKYPISPSPLHSEDFATLSFPLLSPRNNYVSTSEPPSIYDNSQSYSEQFLSHAALYILGDYRLVDSLKALALYKLHKTLCVFQLNDENAQDVVDLARYVYAEEGGGGTGDDIGALRGLVCRYMATNALVLSFDEGFMDLLEEGGQFVRDFFKFEVQRTC